MEIWKKVEKVLEKHNIIGWRCEQNVDEWVETMDKMLSGALLPKEIEWAIDGIEHNLNTLKKLKER